MATRAPLYLDNLTPADVIENVAAILDTADASEWRAGVSWYRTARRIAGVIGRSAGYRGPAAYVVGAGVIAALSPSLDWDRNVAAARGVVATRDRSGDARFQSAANVAKAIRILDGESPLDVLGGSKVRAFYRCILDPSDTAPVCIDRHAAAVAYGRSLTDADMSRAVGGPRFELLADAYRAVGAARGLTPSAVQAITWVTWRNLKRGA